MRLQLLGTHHACTTHGAERIAPRIAALHVTQALLPESYWESLRKEITKDFDGLRDLLRAVVVMKTNDERTREIVSGHGEVCVLPMHYGR